MTIISNLTGAIHEKLDSVAIDKDERAISNTQSNEVFWRRLNHFKDRMVFISSSGGAVQINIDDLWKLAESADNALKIPIAETDKKG